MLLYLKKLMVESLLFIGAGVGPGKKRTGSATLGPGTLKSQEC